MDQSDGRKDVRLEKCLFGRKEVEIPEVLTEDIHLFMEVMSQHTWQNALTEAQRIHLKSLLPAFAVNDEKEKQITMQRLFGGASFKFVSPVKHFHKKLRRGMFSPDIAKYAALCKKAKEREYRYQQKVYYSSLLRDVLVSRQRIIEHLYRHPPEEFVRLNFGQSKRMPSAHTDRSIEHRVRQKCRQLVSEVNEECGLLESSSSDDDDESLLTYRGIPKQQSQRTHVTPNYHTVEFNFNHVQDTFASKAALQSSSHSANSNTSPGAKHKRNGNRLVVVDVTQDQYMSMLHKHKRRKLEYPDHPELDIYGITLDKVVDRVQSSKKMQPLGLTRRKMKKFGQKSSNTSDQKPDIQQLSFSENDLLRNKAVKTEKLDVYSMDSIGADDATADLMRNAGNNASFGQFANFFSLIRHFICMESDAKTSMGKLEELVLNWQRSQLMRCTNRWFQKENNWNDRLHSAIKFLAGSVIGVPVDDFFPLVDYKERTQACRWIGQGRDSDAEIAKLYSCWMRNCRNELESCSIPPPRVSTDCKFRPTTSEEKRIFQAQERDRFSNPHRAFTYRFCGYEAVVGPVKGIYAKENSVRPRDHALLVKDRPACVTILTLVQDAAARLPNGEGTRSQICELVKDSQYLAPDVTDAQITAVVSGALDRLHYDQDPCIKYDGLRKLWVYRHRSRAEDEFERIHQVQGELARAKKKFLQKPKVPKSSQGAKDKSKISLSTAAPLPAAGEFDSSFKSSQEGESGSSHVHTNISGDVSPAVFSLSSATQLRLTDQGLPVCVTPPVSVQANRAINAMSAIKAIGNLTGATPASSVQFMRVIQPDQTSSLKSQPTSLLQPTTSHSDSKLPTVLMTPGLDLPSSVRSSQFDTQVIKTTGGQLASLTNPSSVPKMGSTVTIAPPTVSTSAAKPVIAQFITPTSLSKQKISSMINLAGTNATVIRGLDARAQVFSPAAAAGTTMLCRPTTASSLPNQTITLGVSDPSKHGGLILVTKSTSSTSVPLSTLAVSSPAVTRPIGSQLVSGHQVLPQPTPATGINRPIIVSGQPRPVINTSLARTVQLLGRPIQLVQNNTRTPASQLMHAVRLATSAGGASVQATMPTSAVVTSSRNLVPHLLQAQQQKPVVAAAAAATTSAATRFAVTAGLRPEVGNLIRVAGSQTTGQMKLLNALQQSKLVFPSDHTAGIVIAQLPSQSGPASAAVTSKPASESLHLLKALGSNAGSTLVSPSGAYILGLPASSIGAAGDIRLNLVQAASANKIAPVQVKTESTASATPLLAAPGQGGIGSLIRPTLLASGNALTAAGIGLQLIRPTNVPTSAAAGVTNTHDSKGAFVKDEPNS